MGVGGAVPQTPKALPPRGEPNRRPLPVKNGEGRHQRRGIVFEIDIAADARDDPLFDARHRWLTIRDLTA